MAAQFILDEWSNGSIIHPDHSPVAQLAERLAVNQLVAGSSPARGANFSTVNACGFIVNARPRQDHPSGSRVGGASSAVCTSPHILWPFGMHSCPTCWNLQQLDTLQACRLPIEGVQRMGARSFGRCQDHQVEKSGPRRPIAKRPTGHTSRRATRPSPGRRERPVAVLRRRRGGGGEAPEPLNTRAAC